MTLQLAGTPLSFPRSEQLLPVIVGWGTRHSGTHRGCSFIIHIHTISPKLTTTTIADTAGVTGASRTIGDAVDLRSTVDSVGTPTAIPMLPTTTVIDTPGVTGAS